MPADATIDAPPAIRNRLRKLGLERQQDLVLHLPLRYEDETRITGIAEAPFDVPVQVEGELLDLSVRRVPRRQLVARVSDASGERSILDLRFLSFYGSQQRALEVARDQGRRLRIFGEIRRGLHGREMVHPRYRILAEAEAEAEALPQSLTPVYPTTAGLTQSALRKLIGGALRDADLAEVLDAAWCERHLLPPLATSVALLHGPPPELPAAALQTRSHPAWRRIKFDELLAQQLSLRRAYLARRTRGAPVLLAAGELGRRLKASLPFALTGAQQRVAAEIAADLEHPYPMQRLLQGDVGCGKTIVAALAACQAIEAGHQTAFMAPTEILAEQHFLKLSAWLEPLGIEVACAWLGQSQEGSEAQADDAVAGGDDGAARRWDACADSGKRRLRPTRTRHCRRAASLRRCAASGAAASKGAKNSEPPHQLMMSATPIPRTLAMSYYADLDVSVLDELPPGPIARSRPETRFPTARRQDEVTAVRTEVLW
jgi:ATP-dependent DNA helicase RecG